MTDNGPTSYEKLSVLRACDDREHRLLNERTNIFLLWHSILMTAYALGNQAPVLGKLIPGVGLFGSLIWLHVARCNFLVAEYFREQVKECEKCFPEHERVYSNAQKWRQDVQRRFSESRCHRTLDVP